jgi:hypothetical protein
VRHGCEQRDHLRALRNDAVQTGGIDYLAPVARVGRHLRGAPHDIDEGGRMKGNLGVSEHGTLSGGGGDFHFSFSGEQDHRKLGPSGTHLARQLDTVHARHADIGDQYVILFVRENFQRHGAAGAGPAIEARVQQHARVELCGVGLVVDDQDGGPARRSLGIRRRREGSFRSSRVAHTG